MTYDPTQLDDIEMLQLLAVGLIPYMDEVLAGESIPEFVQQWGPLPLSEWPLKLEVLPDVLTDGDRLLDSELEGRPTQLCYQLAKGILGR